MVRAHNGEVPPVNCGNFIDAQAFSRGHHRGIYGAQWQVSILCDQFGDAQPVGRRHRFHVEGAGSKISQESDLGCCSQSSRQKVHDFRDDKGRDKKRTGMSFK